jgi:hypothetical protein
MGLAGLRLGRSGLGQAHGLDPIWGRFFFEFTFNAKTIPEKPRNCLKARKILRKIKISGKFLEIDYDMNNPNKAFRAHEKDFRALK